MPAKCLTAVLLALASMFGNAALAQTWPTQPIKVIVGFPPGGVADAIPRYLQEKLKDSLGQPIVVENKPGAAGIIAMDAIAKAADGHTVGVMTLQNLIVFDITGEDANGKLIGRHRSTGIARPRFWERAEYYNETEKLSRALVNSEVRDAMGRTMGEADA